MSTPTTTNTSYLLVHGVGMWPGLFCSTRLLLNRPSNVWLRPGYGPRRGPAVPLDQQVDHLAAEVTRRGPTIVVGVSGGATLALALTLRDVPNLAGVLTHEPLVGPLVPSLAATVASAGEQLAVGKLTTGSFLRRLYGPSWERLPSKARHWVADHADTVRHEVAEFSAFQPTRAALSSATVPHLTTVGALSGPERHEVADVLERTGAVRKRIEQAGHLVVVDRPDEFAQRIDAFGTAIQTLGAAA